MRAGVHAQRPADRTGHASQERQAVDARPCGGLGDELVGRSRSRHDAAAVQDLDCAEGPAAEADDDAGHAAVAHDEVRAEADCRDRRLARQGGQEIGEVVLVGRGKQDLRGAADPKPRRLGDRGVGDEASAQPRRARLQFADDVGKAHEPAPLYALSSAASSPGSA